MSNKAIKVTHEDFISNFKKLTLTLESPFTSLRLLGQFLLYKKMRLDGQKVSISGDGGDEMLGGYDYNVPHFIRDKHPNILSANFMNELEKFSKTKIKSKSQKKSKMLNLLISLSFQHGTTSDGTPFLNTDNFNQEYLDHHLSEELFFFKNNEKLNYLKNSQCFDIKNIKLPRVLKYQDRMSMEYGIETRVPFLDHKLFEYIFNLDNEDKINENYETRYIFKKSLMELTSKKIKFRKTKNTITDPQSKWLRKELKPFVLDTFNSTDFKKLDYFNSKNCIKSFDNFCKNKNQSSFHLFQILSFAIFKSIFVKNV
jgi:asparagine synthase (glutamine-hydrolysing)